MWKHSNRLGYKSTIATHPFFSGVIDLFHFERGARKDDLAAEYRQRQAEKEGIPFIGIAQERAYAFRARKRLQATMVGIVLSAIGVRQLLLLLHSR